MNMLIRICCNTDWKGRPTHSIKVLGTGPDADLMVIRELDIRELFLEDLDEKKKLELLSNDELKAKWQNDKRWEMEEMESTQRMFVWNRRHRADDGEGNLISISYTLYRMGWIRPAAR